MICDSFKSVKI